MEAVEVPLCNDIEPAYLAAVANCPCDDCPYIRHCSATGEECRAYRRWAFSGSNKYPGKWLLVDRIPASMAFSNLSARYG